jgi:hypothetical protein
MQDDHQRRTKDIFITWRHRATIVTGVISVPAPAINDNTLRAMHRALII